MNLYFHFHSPMLVVGKLLPGRLLPISQVPIVEVYNLKQWKVAWTTTNTTL
jgi:hypothetical protein